jgi:hypothetical protein
MKRIFKTIVLLTCVAMFSACEMRARTKITVAFTEAPQLRGGETVLLGRQAIGRAEKPRVRAGTVEVDVMLQRNDSLRDETIFLSETAGNGVVLVAFPRGEELVIQAGGAPLRFRGASSQGELAMMVTKEELLSFLKWLNGFADKMLVEMQR